MDDNEIGGSENFDSLHRKKPKKDSTRNRMVEMIDLPKGQNKINPAISRS